MDPIDDLWDWLRPPAPEPVVPPSTPVTPSEDVPLEYPQGVMWTRLRPMLEDMRQFAASHPDHKFLCADNQHDLTYGFVAFREDPEDEQPREWRITTRAVHETRDSRLRISFVASPRPQMLEDLVREARTLPV